MKADERIVQKWEEMSSNEASERKCVLVSSDRELYVRCGQKMKLEHTGGRFFFKFLGKTARNNCKKNKEKKKLLESILHGD